MSDILALEVFEVQRILAADEGIHIRAWRRGVGTRDCPFLALLIEELEDRAELGVIVRIPKAAQGIAVEQDAIVLVGDDEGDGDLRVVLEELLVLSFIIELVGLVLS